MNRRSFLSSLASALISVVLARELCASDPVPPKEEFYEIALSFTNVKTGEKTVETWRFDPKSWKRVDL